MFKNREEAGMLLAEKLKELKLDKDRIIMAIPRGGVVVGAVIAKNLKIPLYALVVKKLGAPGNSELAIGAVAPDNIYYLDRQIIERLDVGQEYIDEEVKRKKKEVEERMEQFSIFPACAGRNFQFSKYRTFILTDDGIATGATILAAIKWIKKSPKSKVQSPKLILAVPVIAKDTFGRLKSEVDEIIALDISDEFFAVGQFYRNFQQTTDTEVKDIISRLGNLGHLS